MDCRDDDKSMKIDVFQTGFATNQMAALRNPTQIYALIIGFMDGFRKSIDIEDGYDAYFLWSDKKSISDLIFLYFHGKLNIKVLFLDVDGVLNIPFGSASLNKTFIQRLKRIIEATNCKIVLSSDWRLTLKHKLELFKELKNNGDIDILNDNIYIGDTPIVMAGFYRALEIDAYLQSQDVQNKYDITKWCAIDDRNLIDPPSAPEEITKQCFEIMCDHFVHTDQMYGLTEQCLEDVIAILK